MIVIAVSGDGDAYGEGGNHFLHSCRRNHNITYLVHDNQVYGLTKGQASPTSDEGFVTKTTTEGAANPIHPMTLAIVAGATFVARGFAGDAEHLAEIIKKGITHKGFSLIDILQPCVSFNHKNTFQWYKERVYKLDDVNGYDPGDKKAAMDKAQEWGDHIPTGVIYNITKPAYEDGLPTLAKGPLVKQVLKPVNIETLMNEFV